MVPRGVFPFAQWALHFAFGALVSRVGFIAAFATFLLLCASFAAVSIFMASIALCNLYLGYIPYGVVMGAIDVKSMFDAVVCFPWVVCEYLYGLVHGVFVVVCFATERSNLSNGDAGILIFKKLWYASIAMLDLHVHF